jgi:hypothetical protein
MPQQRKQFIICRIFSTSFEVQNTIAMLMRCKSSASDEISAEIVYAGCEKL